MIVDRSICRPPRAVSKVDIDGSYVQANVKIVREQLQKAGVRLAHLLETVLHR